jgi:hypothetical protein
MARLWMARGDQAAPEPSASPPEPDDSPAGLRRTLAELVRFINRQSGRLPGAAVVGARRVTDTLAEVVDTAEVRPLDAHTAGSVRAALTDYLPTTLRAYLAVTAGTPAAAGSDGPDPTRLLLDQLDGLQRFGAELLVASRQQDVDALLTQANFLRTKFSGADLELS